MKRNLLDGINYRIPNIIWAGALDGWAYERVFYSVHTSYGTTLGFGIDNILVLIGLN
jgi:hypothetical protein